jgi:ferric-dicitrate binding protein FerR (iron transport regulator)
MRNNQVLLMKGQYSVVHKAGTPFPPATAEISKELAWLKGKMVFEQTPFGEVIIRLERSFDVTFNIPDSTLLKIPFTSKFDHDSLGKILHIISRTMNLKVTRKGKIITVNRKRPS